MSKIKTFLKRSKNIFVYLFVFVMMFGVTAGVLYGCNKQGEPTNIYATAFSTSSKVGYSAKYLGTVDRNVPTEMRDEGFKERMGTDYPTFGKAKKDYTSEQKSALCAENNLLNGNATTNTGGSYDKIDKDGQLWLNGEKLTRQDGSVRTLYKHYGSVGLYGGDVSDDEKGVIKQITLRDRGYNSYSITGLYAPAGEIIKVEMSYEDMEATGGITFHIGQALYNGQANNIWTAKDFSRMPVVLNTLVVDKDKAEYDLERQVYTAYIGSFLGGPIYIRNESATFTVTISGAVNYSHFILGYTTKEEFEANRNSTAPYFDMEVWDCGVLHSGPKVYSLPYSYEDLYDAAIYWDKVAIVSNKIRKQGIVFIYDPFVAAGAAVAFPGRSSVNCPMSWMSSSLNYKQLSTTGAWGNMHEFNHNFQGWGRGSGGEVTNNAINLVEYALFTKISSARQIDNFGAEGLSAWNRYTSATWAINQALSIKRENDLSVYAAILHNFGPDMFIQCVNQQQKGSYGESFDGWARAVTEATHYDMRYFYNNLVNGYSVSNNWVDNVEGIENFPTFIPIACVYQTGRSYTYDGEKRYIKTQQPYQIHYGEEFVLDLSPYKANNANMYESGSIIIPSGFSYNIKSITQPKNGVLVPSSEEQKYVYLPLNNQQSGEILLTLEIIPPENSGIASQEVELIIELEPTREINKLMLERTRYIYDTNIYTSAKKAYEEGYKGFSSTIEEDNENPIQNSNTDIWYYTAPTNEVVEIRGKIYVDETADYRMAIRGRWSVAFYYSLNEGKSYTFGGEYNQSGASAEFSKSTETYVDFINTLKAGQWIYFKEIMVTGRNKSGTNSFIGLGWGKFVPGVPELDEEGNPTGRASDPTIKIDFASAYRNSYEFAETGYSSEYFYTKNYQYNYEERNDYQKNVEYYAEESNFEPWDNTTLIENMLDGNTNTFMHTRQNVRLITSQGTHTANKYIDSYFITLDLKQKVTVNQFIMNLRSAASNNLGRPIDLKLYGSFDGINFTEIESYEDLPYVGLTQTLSFPNSTLRYFKFEVTKTDNGYLILKDVLLRYEFDINGGKQIEPDNKMFTYKGNWRTEATQSTFGHIYAGKDNAIMEFSFVGNRLGIFSNKTYGKDFEVYIDGKRVSSIGLKEQRDEIIISFISNQLRQGNHKVKIKCKGNANIDSIVIW